MISSNRMKPFGIGLIVATSLLASPAARCEPALSGSDARRAALCAGDYVCDEDGSFGIADITAQERAQRIREHEIERLIADGKIDPRPRASGNVAQQLASE